MKRLFLEILPDYYLDIPRLMLTGERVIYMENPIYITQYQRANVYKIHYMLNIKDVPILGELYNNNYDIQAYMNRKLDIMYCGVHKLPQYIKFIKIYRHIHEELSLQSTLLEEVDSLSNIIHKFNDLLLTNPIEELKIDIEFETWLNNKKLELIKER